MEDGRTQVIDTIVSLKLKHGICGHSMCRDQGLGMAVL